MAPNPLAIHYSNTPGSINVSTTTGWARPGCTVILDTDGPRVHKAQIPTLRANDCEVLMYVILCNPHPNESSSQIERKYLYNKNYAAGGSLPAQYLRSQVPSAWYWDPSNPLSHYVSSVDVGNLPCFDFRAGSAWCNQAVNWFTDWLANRAGGDAGQAAIDGLFLDVFGHGLSALRGFTDSEKALWNAGIDDTIRRMRQAAINLGGDAANVILHGNDSWEGKFGASQGSVYMDGFSVENHSTGEMTFWRGQVQSGNWRGVRPRFYSINRISASGSSTNAAGYYDADFQTHVSYDNYSTGAAQSTPISVGGRTIAPRGWTAGENHIHLWSPGSTSTPPPPDPEPVDIPEAPATTPGADVFGSRVIGSQKSAMSSDWLRVSRYRTTAAGGIFKIRALIDGLGGPTTGSQAVRAVVMGTAVGEPDTVLGSSAEVMIAAGARPAWVEFTVAVTSVGKDVDVYMGLHSGSTTGIARYYWSSQPGIQRLKADTYSDGADSPVGATSTGEALISMYAELTPAGVAGANAAIRSLGAATNRFRARTQSGIKNVVQFNVPVVVTIQSSVFHEVLEDGSLGPELVFSGGEFRYRDN